MCGLVGIASLFPQTERAWLSYAREALTHRGPDGSGEWWSKDFRIGLAHQRLAIHDLSSAGHQPMHDVDGSLSIVFNGEIYNFSELRRELIGRGHPFRSQTDTEVILASYREWGTDCLTRFNGMFAFALYDSIHQKLLLARDRAGEKPLFIHNSNGDLRFASELKALMADHRLPRRIDSESLDCYLAFSYVPGNRCMLQGFEKLPPAHALTFDLRTGKSQTWQYWKPPAVPEVETVQDDILLDEFEELLANAVNRQMAADVPVGVLLSGGLDSSLITAMAARNSGRVKTFTIGFPGHGSLDETGHARLVAKHFGTEHTELMAQPATADLMPRLARQFDEPIVDSSMIPTFLVSQLVREHCTVALGGDGGDELFGGYGHYNRLLWMQAHLWLMPCQLRYVIAKSAEKLLPLGFAGGNIRSWLIGLKADLANDLPLITSYFEPTSRRRMMAEHCNLPMVAEGIIRDRIPNETNLLQRSTRMDFQNYLVEDILVKVDRASMLNSLEVRAPMLDQHVLDFAFGKVPSRLKATQNEKKILLKRLAARVLPPEFDRQRKQGFEIPIAQWLKSGPFRELFHDVLKDPGCVFDAKAVDSLLRGQDLGRKNGERLFSLVIFELWRREYSVTF